MKRKQILAGAALIAAALAGGGCASIVSRSKYTIPLQSNVEATVDVRNRGRFVMKARTPTTLTLDSDAGYFQNSQYTFTFKRDGYPDVVKSRNAYMNGWYVGNVVFGGLIGWLLVDPMSGAMWRLDENPIVVQYEQAPGDAIMETTR